MKLILDKIDKARGIYTIKGVKNQLPARMRFLAPEAAKSFRENLAGPLVISDMRRSAESSLQAVREKRGAKAPAYSAHNFGFAIDIDVAAAMKLAGWTKKRDLDEWMASKGWFCHRRDGLLKSESWHYNFLGDVGGAAFIDDNANSTADAIEHKIVAVYGPDFKLSKKDVQAGLAKLKMYSGEIDGKFGPLTKEAIRVFQRAWDLTETGEDDQGTQRTLAFVTAEAWGPDDNPL